MLRGTNQYVQLSSHSNIVNYKIVKFDRYCVLLIADSGNYYMLLKELHYSCLIITISGYSYEPHNISMDNIVLLSTFCRENNALFLSPRAKHEDNTEIYQIGKKCHNLKLNSNNNVHCTIYRCF